MEEIKKPDSETQANEASSTATANEETAQPNVEASSNTKEKKPLEKTFKYNLKKWFYGLGKEFSRITWTPLKKVWINFFIVVCVVLFFALVFYGVDFVVMNNFKK